MTASEKTTEELGIGRLPPSQDVDEWKDYKTLASPPAAHPQRDQWSSSIYRGLVPAKNITKGDFAINGAFVSRIRVNKDLDVFLIDNTVHVMFYISRWTVHHEQWIYVRGDRALDIIVLSWGQDAFTLHGRTSTGGGGEERSLDKEATPRHAVVGQREL